MLRARAIGEKLTQAARLAGRAVCVIGSEDPFPGSGRLGEVDRCIARVVCGIALDRKAGPVTFGLDAKDGICPGGQMWCGLASASPKLKFFLSTGTPELMGGAAEHLKPTPEAAERFLGAPGDHAPGIPELAATTWWRDAEVLPRRLRHRGVDAQPERAGSLCVG